jgi:hypothetical protein
MYLPPLSAQELFLGKHIYEMGLDILKKNPQVLREKNCQSDPGVGTGGKTACRQRAAKEGGMKTRCIKKGASAKPARKKPRPIGSPNFLMKIHGSLDQIREKKLADMNFFELSIHSLMQTDVYREIRNRLMLAQASLEVGDAKAARAIVDKLLASPQPRRGS